MNAQQNIAREEYCSATAPKLYIQPAKKRESCKLEKFNWNDEDLRPIIKMLNSTPNLVLMNENRILIFPNIFHFVSVV